MNSREVRQRSSMTRGDVQGIRRLAPTSFAGPSAMIAGVVVIVALGVRVTAVLPKHHLVLLASFALSDLLIVATLVVLRRTDACGDGASARIGLGLASFGYLMDVPGELLTEASRPVAGTLSGVGTLLFAVGLIVAGISMLRARRWHGWHRFVPLALGAYIPVVLLPSLMLRRGPNLAFGFLGVIYLVLGLAVRAEQTTSG